MNGVSVIVCCYNSASRIEETLNFIAQQKIIDLIFWEVIVVNNASKDSTKEKVNQFIHNLNDNLQFRLIDEQLPGLINARNCGIRNATYDLIIFCDDDNHLDENYVETAFQLMNRLPNVAIAGGWCKPKLSLDPGKWIEPNYAALAIEKSARNEGDVNWVFGAGMIVRKEIFQLLKQRGIELLLTGRVEGKQTSGDDAELCQIVKFLGYRVYYSPNLILHHKVSSTRLTRWSFIKANYRNVFMMVYFFLLDKIINHHSMHSKELYKDFFFSGIKNSFYYLPRIFFGKNTFFSFMMFYQNVQLVFWSALRRKKFFETYDLIVNNLYSADGTK